MSDDDAHPALAELHRLFLEMREAIDEGLRIIGEEPLGDSHDGHAL